MSGPLGAIVGPFAALGALQNANDFCSYKNQEKKDAYNQSDLAFSALFNVGGIVPTTTGRIPGGYSVLNSLNKAGFAQPIPQNFKFGAVIHGTISSQPGVAWDAGQALLHTHF